MKIIDAKNDDKYLYLTVEIPIKDLKDSKNKKIDKNTIKEDKIKCLKDAIKNVGK